MNSIFEKIKKSSILRFVIVGGCSTALDFCIYMLLSLKMNVTISKGISLIIASIASYFANKIFTFENKEKTNFGYLIKYYLVFATNLTVNIGANYLMLKYTNQKVVSFIIATICGMTVNYCGQRFFVFRRKKPNGV